MKKERDALRRIEALAEPRDLPTLPNWIDSSTLDRLVHEGYITFTQLQCSNGSVEFIRGLQLTPKGYRLMHSDHDWPRLAWKGSLAGASLTAMSVVILYWG